MKWVLNFGISSILWALLIYAMLQARDVLIWWSPL
jgi:hypothetical protein